MFQPKALELAKTSLWFPPPRAMEPEFNICRVPTVSVNPPVSKMAGINHVTEFMVMGQKLLRAPAMPSRVTPPLIMSPPVKVFRLESVNTVLALVLDNLLRLPVPEMMPL